MNGQEQRRAATGAAPVTVMTIVLTLAGALAAGPAPAQGWLAGMLESLKSRAASYKSADDISHRSTRLYYARPHTIPLGELVAETGADTRATWQARLSRDARKIGVPRRLTPAERHEDQINPEYQRWRNDPTHW
jgi:hypothetical protein